MQSGPPLGRGQQGRHDFGQEEAAAGHQQTTLKIKKYNLWEVKRSLGKTKEVPYSGEFPKCVHGVRGGL